MGGEGSLERMICNLNSEKSVSKRLGWEKVVSFSLQDIMILSGNVDLSDYS